MHCCHRAPVCSQRAARDSCGKGTRDGLPAGLGTLSVRHSPTLIGSLRFPPWRSKPASAKTRRRGLSGGSVHEQVCPPAPATPARCQPTRHSTRLRALRAAAAAGLHALPLPAEALHSRGVLQLCGRSGTQLAGSLCAGLEALPCLLQVRELRRRQVGLQELLHMGGQQVGRGGVCLEAAAPQRGSGPHSCGFPSVNATSAGGNRAVVGQATAASSGTRHQQQWEGLRTPSPRTATGSSSP